MISIKDENNARVITLSNPDKHNALGVENYLQLADAFIEADQRKDISSIQIMSTGHTFCAGNDLAEFETEWPQPKHGPVYQFFNAIESTKVPIIAGVQGGAIGLGATMLLHCDVVLMTEKAWLSYPFVSLGITPEGGASQILPTRLGYTRAIGILLSGRRIMAQEAMSIGLATALIESNALTIEMSKWSTEIASFSRSAVTETKKLIHQESATPISELFEIELQVINGLIKAQPFTK